MESRINYELCVFCQKNNRTEKLKNLSNASDKSIISQTYNNICGLLSKYKKHDKLNEYGHLNEMNSWATAFEQFNAKWHKSCRLKFSAYKLEKLTKIPKNRVVGSNDLGNTSTNTRSKILTDTQPKESKNVCLFCDLGETEAKKLHLCATMELDEKIRKLCPNSAEYSSVKLKLSQGDVIAIDAKYHLACLSAFYKITQRVQSNDEDYSAKAFEIVFKHINDWLQDDEENIIFLKDLHSLYFDSLQEVEEDSHSINRTRLKTKVLIVSRIALVQERKGNCVLQT